MRWAVLILTAAVIAPGAAAQTAPPVAVTGVVLDQTDAVLGGAQVELRDASGRPVQTGTSDGGGTFRFSPVPPGRYELAVILEGFQSTTARITVGTRPPPPVRIAMRLAGVTQHVTVNGGDVQVTSDAGGNGDAIAVDQGFLEGLPVMSQDYIGTLSRFLDTGSLGTGGATVVVNGMEVNGLTVSASAIQQIKINQDPYSAEYSRPGRGRIEILTKPGSQAFHGDGNVVVRDAHLDASNAFAATRPPEQRRILEGYLGGPIGRSGRTSFMMSASADTDDQRAIVVALGLDGRIQGQASQPNRRALASGSITHQVSDRNSFSFRPAYQEESNRNRGVGGTTLPSAGSNFLHHEEQLTYTQQTFLGTGLVNQLQLLGGAEREPTTSVTRGVGIVVSGAFAGGGAQADNLRTEHHMQAAETLTWTKGHHLVGGGFQIPDWSRRRFDDQSLADGKFYFADLAAYAAGRPYSFVQQRGTGHVVLLEKVLGVFLKDDWQATPHLTASMGLRYDWTNHFNDHFNLAPRGSIAYSPGTKTTVFRAGAGVFYDKPGPAPYGDVLASQPGGVQRIVLSNPGYPAPFAADAAVAPPSIVQFAPDIRVPYLTQYSAGVERQVRKGTTVALTYIGSKGSLFRSRDVNAPLPPLYAARPDPTYGVVRQIESAARQQADALQATLRGRVTKWFNGQAQYTLGRTYNDSGGLNSFPANDYDLSGEWARADFDRRHRFQLLGRIVPGRLFDLGIGLSVQSGAPYSESIGADVLHNARGGARPAGVSRNSREGGGYASLDVRAAKDVTFAKGTPRARTLTISIDAFNVVNQVNYTGYVGTIGSPLFGQPIVARPPRQLQVSTHLKF
jgi:hypothetical protein